MRLFQGCKKIISTLHTFLKILHAFYNLIALRFTTSTLHHQNHQNSPISSIAVPLLLPASLEKHTLDLQILIMNNNLRMSGAMFLMLKKSSDRRQREALEAAFKVRFRLFPTIFVLLKGTCLVTLLNYKNLPKWHIV